MTNGATLYALLQWLVVQGDAKSCEDDSSIFLPAAIFKYVWQFFSSEDLKAQPLPH